jgi:hypothetical protein
MVKAKKPTSGRKQIAKFRKIARELECNESEEAFDRALGKIGKAKPPAATPPRKKRVR